MNASRALVRTFSQSTKVFSQNPPVHRVYKEVQKNYKRYQADDGLLVHQKGGLPDNILFGTTIVILGTAFILAGKNFYTLFYK